MFLFFTLKKKRTYEIENGHLEDYYDTDVIANDEFLTKYLAKNKEVVLGEIIATIQKEQNEIIRDTPWHSVIGALQSTIKTSFGFFIMPFFPI